LVALSPKDRIGVAEALMHAYFNDLWTQTLWHFFWKWKSKSKSIDFLLKLIESTYRF
jgi:hypothetical protein